MVVDTVSAASITAADVVMWSCAPQLDDLADAVPHYMCIQDIRPPFPVLTYQLAIYVERLQCAAVITVRMSFRSGMLWTYFFFTCTGSVHASCSRSRSAFVSRQCELVD